VEVRPTRYLSLSLYKSGEDRSNQTDRVGHSTSKKDERADYSDGDQCTTHCVLYGRETSFISDESWGLLHRSTPSFIPSSSGNRFWLPAGTSLRQNRFDRVDGSRNAVTQKRERANNGYSDQGSGYGILNRGQAFFFSNEPQNHLFHLFSSDLGELNPPVRR
jgi:hypothetical protein